MQALAADDVPRFVLTPQRLVGEAAHALVAAREEAEAGRELAEVVGRRVAHLEAADQPVAVPKVRMALAWTSPWRKEESDSTLPSAPWRVSRRR